jgi:hypothetical protein|nr:hypothetical protein [uncultured Flavobacterium sp.]
MKKAILTIGLFTLVLVSTSFASPNNSVPSVTTDNTGITSIDGTGSQDTGRTKKVDFNGGGMKYGKTNQIADIDGTGSQDTGRTKKVD